MTLVAEGAPTRAYRWGVAAVLLAPLRVWLGVGEAPAGMTLIGGAVVLAALLLQIAGAARRAPAAA